MEGSRFMKEFQRLSLDPEFTDAVIKCGGREWKVHRNILACHGKFFKRCWQRGFVESETHVLDLAEDDPEAIDALLKDAYKFDYDDVPKEGSDFANALELDATVYALADKYECVDLANMAVKKFTFAAVAASKLTAPPYEAIRIVYDTTPSDDRRLRDICMKLWAAMEDQARLTANKSAVNGLLRTAGDFSDDVTFLAPSSCDTIRDIFKEHSTEYQEAARESLLDAYGRTTPPAGYARRLDLQDSLLEAVAGMLRKTLRDMSVMCESFVGKDWENVSRDFAAYLTRALDPHDATQPYMLFQPPPSHLGRVLERRARVQLRLHWQTMELDAEVATKQTLDAIFGNFEMCHVVFAAARGWTNTYIDKRLGTAWIEVVQHNDQVVTRLKTKKKAEVAAAARLQKAQEATERGRTEQQRIVQVTAQIQESHMVKMNLGDSDSHAAQLSFESLQAERLADMDGGDTGSTKDTPAAHQSEDQSQ